MLHYYRVYFACDRRVKFMENFKVWGRVKERILFLLLIIDIMVTTVSIKVAPITIHEPTGRLNIKFKPTPATA